MHKPATTSLGGEIPAGSHRDITDGETPGLIDGLEDLIDQVLRVEHALS
jgi:hypothetical protein